MSTPTLSPGGARAFTFADIIHALQQDTANANPAQTLDFAFTLLTAVVEKMSFHEKSVTATTSSSVPVWGTSTMVWGQFVWN